MSPTKKVCLLAVTGMVLTAGILQAVNTSTSSEREYKEPIQSSERDAGDPKIEDNGASAAVPTLIVTKRGTRIELQDSSTAQVRKWDAKKRGFASTTPAASFLKGGSLPPKSSRDSRDRWLMIEENGVDGRETSVVSTNRDRKGRLVPMSIRIWDTRAELAWDEAKATSWTLQKNESKPFKVSGGSYIDTDHDSAESVRYTLTGTIPDPKSRKGADSHITFVLIVPPPPGERVNASKEASQTWSDHLRMASRGPGRIARFVEWNSFIEPSEIEVPLACNAEEVLVGLGTAKYFIGDGRSYTSGAGLAFNRKGDPLSRLSSRVGAGWDPANPNLNDDVFDDWIYKGVGVTRELDENFEEVRRAWAGDTGIRLTTSTSDAFEAYRVVEMAGSDPLCQVFGVQAPDINVWYDAWFTDDGYFDMYADFDKAPTTEVNWEATSDPSDASSYLGGCLYRFENKGFHNLASLSQQHIFVMLYAPPGGPCSVN